MSCFRKGLVCDMSSSRDHTTTTTTEHTTTTPWSDLSWEVWVHIWGYLESRTLWTCRQVSRGWDRYILGAASRLGFDLTCLDMSHWVDYTETLERATSCPEVRGMFATVQHIKVCCSTTGLGRHAAVDLCPSVWMGQFLALYALPQLVELTLDCDCTYRGRVGTSLVGVGWREAIPSFDGCLLMFPARWLADHHRLEIRQTNIGIATCPDSLHFAPFALRPRIALCQPALTVRQLRRWVDHLPGLKSLSLRESPLSYNFNRARGLLANALLPLVLQGMQMRRLYRLDVLRVHLHGADGEALWTPMQDLLSMLAEYPLVAWHPQIRDLGPVLRDRPLAVELVLSAPPPRQHDWTEMTARAVAVYQTMRPDTVAGPITPDWPWLAQAAVLAPGDEVNLCPMLNAETVGLARTLVHQDIVHERVQALQSQHRYIYGPSPRVVVAALGVRPYATHEDSPLLDESDDTLGPPSASPPLLSSSSSLSASPSHHQSPPPLPPSPPPPPARSPSGTPDLDEQSLGEAVAFCYPSLPEFTRWQMMHEVQQMMDSFKVHLENNCPHVGLERPLVVCQGHCPVAAATSVPTTDTTRADHQWPTTILPAVDLALLNQLRQELATESSSYQLAVFQTSSPADPPSFLCHCRPPLFAP